MTRETEKTYYHRKWKQTELTIYWFSWNWPFALDFAWNFYGYIILSITFFQYCLDLEIKHSENKTPIYKRLIWKHPFISQLYYKIVVPIWKYSVCSWKHKKHHCYSELWRKGLDRWHCEKCHPCSDEIDRFVRRVGQIR